MTMIRFQDPDEPKKYTLSWGNVTDDALTSSVWTVPPSITQGASGYDGSAQTTYSSFSGIVDKQSYEIVNTVTTATDTFQRTFFIVGRDATVVEVRELPLGVDDLKHALRITHDNDDTLLVDLLKAAVEMIEAETCCTLINRSVTVTFPRFSDLQLTDAPLQAVARIRYYDGDGVLQTLAIDQYRVVICSDTSVIVEPTEGNYWPGTQVRSDAVEVLLVAGYGAAAADIPDRAKVLLRMLVRHWYDNPAGAVTGTIFQHTTPGIQSLIDSLKTGYYADV